MKIVIFGLTYSSSWGNGHATLWRGLCGALVAMQHRVVFFERDLSYYAGARDMPEMPGGRLVLYPFWDEALPAARSEIRDADVVIVTSYCPDGCAAIEILDDTRGLRVFYDMDTPVTLSAWSRGEPLSYLPSRGLVDFDLVLSFTGGDALTQLKKHLGAKQVAPLYGHVDPSIHCRVDARPHYRSDLSYLGTYSPDRQQAVLKFLIRPAQEKPAMRILIAGAQYPHEFPWSANTYFVRHLPPSEHPAFFSSSRITLNVTRGAMARLGWCPSGRMFEAAACGTPVLSDCWEGIGQFFRPGQEILVARTDAEIDCVLGLSDQELAQVGRAGRERALSEHTSSRRALELIALLQRAHAHDFAET